MLEETTKISEATKGRLQYLDLDLSNTLDNECPKDENGNREESYSKQIKRLIASELRRQSKEKAKICKPCVYVDVDSQTVVTTGGK